MYKVKQDIVNEEGEKIFQIGHKVKSETKAPKFCPIFENDAEIFLVDGPGINDSNFRNEYAN